MTHNGEQLSEAEAVCDHAAWLLFLMFLKDNLYSPYSLALVLER